MPWTQSYRETVEVAALVPGVLSVMSFIRAGWANGPASRKEGSQGDGAPLWRRDSCESFVWSASEVFTQTMVALFYWTVGHKQVGWRRGEAHFEGGGWSNKRRRMNEVKEYREQGKYKSLCVEMFEVALASCQNGDNAGRGAYRNTRALYPSLPFVLCGCFLRTMIMTSFPLLKNNCKTGSGEAP